MGRVCEQQAQRVLAERQHDLRFGLGEARHLFIELEDVGTRFSFDSLRIYNQVFQSVRRVSLSFSSCNHLFAKRLRQWG